MDCADCMSFNGYCRGDCKPKTNADRIRAMTDEELAEWISCNCTGDGYGNEAKDWLEWLNEVDDG